MMLFTVAECRYMISKTEEIVAGVKPIDDGGLDVIKRVMIDVLGEDCPAKYWNEIFDDVVYELK